MLEGVLPMGRPVIVTPTDYREALEIADRAIGYPSLEPGQMLMLRDRVARAILASAEAAAAPSHDETTCHVCASNREKETDAAL